MNGDLMYELALDYMAGQQRTAARHRLARSATREGGGWLASRRARRARRPVATPVIPDYVHELLAARGAGSVPAPRQPEARARSGR